MNQKVNQKATQIVKVNIGEIKTKRRRVKRKAKAKKTAITGTGNLPFLGTPQYGQVPIPAPFARQGWTLEPVIAKQIEQPPIQRIEQQPPMNLTLPTREIRDYMGRMLESQFNINGRSQPIIEEVQTAPPSPRAEKPALPVLPSLPAPEKQPLGRAEKPASPLLLPQQPPPLMLPQGIKIFLPPKEDKEEKEEKKEEKRVELVEKERSKRSSLTAEEMQELRNEGKLTREFLNQFVKSRSSAKEGEMSLEEIATKLGLYVPSKNKKLKGDLITYILENS